MSNNAASNAFDRLVFSNDPKSNVQGMVTLITEFDKALSMDFSSVGELIQRVKEALNRVNRQSRETLGNLTMIPNQLAAMKVMSLFLSQYWGNQVDYSSQGFCLDKLEALLRNVFMNKSSSEIHEMASVSTVPVHHVKNRGSLGKRNIQKSDECFYCDGRYNRDDRPHRRVDCPAKQRDEARGCHRSKIFQKAKEISVAHVKSKRGASKKKVRVEIPVDAAFVKPSIKPTPVAAARAEDPLWNVLTPEQAKADIDALMASPPPTPGSPVVSDTPMSAWMTSNRRRYQCLPEKYRKLPAASRRRLPTSRTRLQLRLQIYGRRVAVCAQTA